MKKTYPKKPATWILSFLILFNTAHLFAGEKEYRYSVDLENIERDRYQVTLDCRDFRGQELVFRFPGIIPGTYRTADYGKYIKNLQAFDSQGRNLPVKKDEKNAFHIRKAGDLARIQYWVNDTFDARCKKDKVYPMAGTNNDAGRNFILNAAGVFGYFDGEELNPVLVDITKPADLYGLTVLQPEITAENSVLYRTADYHELVDSPVMFSIPDTVSFMVRNTRILVGVDRESGDERYAALIAEELRPAMEASGDFLGSLPVDNYTFIIYFADRRSLGKALEARHFRIARVIADLFRNGLPMGGALEHNTSCLFYMLDLGDKYRDGIFEAIVSAGVHEFMHIITPLTLHSELVGNFDYANPVMSKHLWLYEGLTEYFAQLILVQGGLVTPQEFLFKIMTNKIRSGEKFPNDKMSFTELSTNALSSPHKRQYNQVYQRGAVIGMLLDLEIIRLTDGEKSLIDVVQDLSRVYGKERSFDEESFIDEFVAQVHPDLKIFFDKYIEGRDELPYDSVLANAGILLEPAKKDNVPEHYIRDRGVKTDAVLLGKDYTVNKIRKKKNTIGYEKGDLVPSDLYWKMYMDEYGDYLPEGSVVEIPVTRNGERIFLPDTVKYRKKKVSSRLRIDRNRSVNQERYYNTWLGIE